MGGGQGAGFWPQSLREAALKIQEMGAGAGEGGAGPSITWMLSRGGLGGSSQQIIKLSLIVAESEGWRGVSHKGRGVPPAGHEKHVFGEAPPPPHTLSTDALFPPRSRHSLGMKDGRGSERSADRRIPP